MTIKSLKTLAADQGAGLKTVESTDALLLEQSSAAPAYCLASDFLTRPSSAITYDNDISGLSSADVKGALDELAAVAGQYIPLVNANVTGTTDAPVSGTWRRYSNAGSITITLGDELVDGGECVLEKVSGAGTTTIANGSGKTINSTGDDLTLAGIVSVRRRGTDYLVSGGASVIKDFDNSVVTNFKPHVQVKTTGYTLVAADSGTIIYCTGSFTVSWPNLGDFQCTVIAATGNVTIDGTGSTSATVNDEASAMLIQGNSVQSVFHGTGRTVVS